MTTSFELADNSCPRCGHDMYTDNCSIIGCDDGVIDLYEDDPLWYDPGETEPCRECCGYGFHVWCPKCGFDLHRDGEE